MAKNYIEKLQDPRWQKKRLTILIRDQWMCQSCCATDETLHVHHKYYEWGKDPWDYDNKHLVTLCDECHHRESGYKKSKTDLIQTLSLNFLDSDISQLAFGFRQRNIQYNKEQSDLMERYFTHLKIELNKNKG